MKDEIKEILDKLKNGNWEYENDKYLKELYSNEIDILLNHITNQDKKITNLQEENKKMSKQHLETVNKLIETQEENEKLKETINDDMTVYLKGLEDGKEKMKQCFESIYKQRNKKAIEYIKEAIENDDYLEDDISTDINEASYDKYINSNKLLNILTGGDDNENK